MNIVFVGDVMLGRLVNAALKVEPPNYLWGVTFFNTHRMISQYVLKAFSGVEASAGKRA
jgi:hypothetical protein